jgi:hypothetical protein
MARRLRFKQNKPMILRCLCFLLFKSRLLEQEETEATERDGPCERFRAGKKQAGCAD